MLNAITAPTLLVSEFKVRRNLQRMAARAQRHGLQLRPHFKTHQSEVVGEWCKEYGVSDLSVTSLRMAREFAAHGWRRMTIAMPVNPRELPALQALALTLPNTTDLTVFLADTGTATILAERSAVTLSYFIEIDAGYGRSGVLWSDVPAIQAVIEAAGPHHFRGFYVHSGHSYDAASVAAIDQLHAELIGRVVLLREQFPQAQEFAIGDTPACSTQEDFRGVSSIGPGNFVYYDLTQAGLGACGVSDIALCLAAPVVQVIAGRGEAIVHAGWVQLGKDRLPDGTYGRVVRLATDGSWSAPIDGATVSKLSQEHGTLRLPPTVLDSLRPGELVGILPVHACATVHGMRVAGTTLYLP